MTTSMRQHSISDTIRPQGHLYGITAKKLKKMFDQTTSDIFVNFLLTIG